MTAAFDSTLGSIWRIDCGRLPPAAIEAGLVLVPADERERGRRLQDPARSLQWLGLRVALRSLLAVEIGRERASAPFVTDPSGRPSIAGGPHFSISDCGPLALIAIADGAVGVDLEAVRPVRIADWRRAALEARATALTGGRALPADPDERFIQAWTRLEAIAKATGRGLGRTIGRLESAGRTPSGGAAATSDATESSWPAVRDLEPWRGHRAAIAGGARVLATIGAARELRPGQLAAMTAWIERTSR